MASSFFTTQSPTELYQKSNVFSTRIGTEFADLGLTSAQATAYAALNTAYAAAYDVANTEATRTKAAIAARNQAAVPLRQMASDLAKIILGHGVPDGTLIELGLSVRKTPEPLGPPGTPANFKVQLLPNGSLDLSWKCQTPGGGVIYHVSRRDEPAGEFRFLGGSPQRKFLDAAVPAGASQITYAIQGVRASGIGVEAQFVVNLGKADGVMTATVAAAAPASPKLAA